MNKQHYKDISLENVEIQCINKYFGLIFISVIQNL